MAVSTAFDDRLPEEVTLSDWRSVTTCYGWSSSLGRVWFRRLDKVWHCLTSADLLSEHQSFFGALLGQGAEVKAMGTLLKELERVCPTPGTALAAQRTWLLIKSLGYIQTRESMPRSTFARHCADLRAAGMRIPVQTGHAFHDKLDSHSRANWTLGPRQTGQ